jgi:RecB family exonuclease
MALTVVTGVANTGKTGRCMALLENASRQRRRAVLLVPTYPDVRRSQRELADKGILGIDVSTIDSWIDALWARFGDGRRIVDDATRIVLIGRVLEDQQRSGLPVTEGVTRLLAKLIARDASTWPASPTGSIESLREAGAHYLSRLEEYGFIERAAAVRGLGGKDFGPPDLVVLNRFTDLTPYQESFVCALSASSDVCVALTWASEHAPTAVLTPLVDRLLAVADAHETVHEKVFTTAGLVELSESLYSGRVGLRAPEGLVVGEAQGTEAEAALTASLVRGAVDEGIAPGAIAVVFRRPAQRAAILANQLAALGIECEMDVSVKLASTPLGAVVLSLLRQVSDTATREGLLAVALSPYSGIAADEVESADVAWRSRRLSGELLLEDAAARVPGLGEIVALARGCVDGRLDAERAARWQELATLLVTNALAARGIAAIDTAMDAAVHRRVLTAIGRMAEMAEGVAPRAVIAALAEERVSVSGEERADAVLFTEAHRVRGRRFDVLVVGGLTAGEFSAERPESLASTILRRIGAQEGVNESLEERMLFYLITALARQRLILVRQSVDDEGEPVRPSSFWDEVLDLYREEDEAESPSAPRQIEVVRMSLDDLAAVAPVYGAGRRERRVLAAKATIAAWHRGELKDARSLELLARDRAYSASELEAYLRCPFKWFYERVLRPAELDREVDAREAGSEAHLQLKSFYDRWSAAGHERVTPELLPEALDVLRDIQAQRHVKRATSALRLDEELRLARADQMVADVVTDDAEFLPGGAPVAHELKFGRDGQPEILFAGFRFSGSVDRVDEIRGGLVVTDYKSGKVSGRASFDTEMLLQLPIYAVAASQLLGQTCIGAVYRSMKSLKVRGFYLDGRVDLCGRGSSGDGVDETGFEHEMERAADLVQRAVRGIRDGLIVPTPGRFCTQCDARHACGRGSS